MDTMPVDEVLPEVREALRTKGKAVLAAPPGAGKTTRVPLALLDEPWLAGKRILMLEPRRLAARAAARYMAAGLGEKAGETVGYRVRLETKAGPKTRIEVITEGVLTRLLQADPALEGVGLVIFDEFHERSLHADLGLALCLQSRSLLREDLRLLVMSATLEAEAAAALLGDAPVVVSEGRSYPVETRFASRRVDGPVEPVVIGAIREALRQDEGDLLVFLPGAGEIRRVEEALAGLDPGKAVRVAPLYGNLPQEVQDLALSPAPPGERKVVLATSIAETSLTVEGVRVVIDSGLSRVPRFSSRTGMTRLETVRVSRASADQRRGRAGRLGPGVCYRLWTEEEDRRLVPHGTPEILEGDLAPLALELAAWGVKDPGELLWLDPPPPGAFAQARELLAQLGALDGDGSINAHGRRMAELGLHPRLAHMVLAAIPLGLGTLACELAALLEERDLFRGGALAHDGDIRLRVEALRKPGETAPGGHPVDGAVRRRVLAGARHWQGLLGLPTQAKDDVDGCGLLLAFAYPDRIAQGKGKGRFVLRNGRGAAFAQPQSLWEAPYLAAAELADQGAESRIYLAAPLELEQLEEHFGRQMTKERSVTWDRAVQGVRARKRERLGALLLRDEPWTDPDPEAVLAALLEGIAQEGLAILPWTKAARQLRQRMAFLHHQEEGWPDVSEEALAASLEHWLAPHLYGMKGREDLQRLDLAAILEGMLPWEKRRELEEKAPTHYAAPSGSRIAIDYSNPADPVLAVRLQEVFGLKETPRIAGGRAPLTLHLLSPAHRPVQVTRDLASFWQTTYFEVKKDLKGRYPKHYWPDDPTTAVPTNRTRPKPQG